jgi:alpha-L-fucosidase 2
MKFPRYVAFLLLSLVACCAAEIPPASPSSPTNAVDWAAFLARQDLVWAANPTAWEEAPFIGNGNLGATMYLQEGAFSWEVNRADFAHNGSRYPMGHVALVTAGKITGGDSRLELWNAEAHGTVKTDQGSVQWRSFAAASPGVIAIELEGTAGEGAAALGWVPASAISPDKIARKTPITAEDQPPAATIAQSSDGFTSVQSFKDGGAYAVALRATPAQGPKHTYFLTIESAATSAEALANAERIAAAAATTGLRTIEAAHRAWWHNYYPTSFVSFPDARLESFYWIQIYKLGSAMRADGPILDLMGPWYRKSPWLRIWFNLNVQLTYSPLATANRLALAESLYGALDRGTPALINNVPPKLRPNAAVIGRSASYDLARGINLGDPNRSQAGSEAGNLPWTMYYYWQYATYQNDDTLLRNRVFPLLKLAINHYLAYLERDAKGHYHLPPTLSPELAIVPDCNYDLALLRWGCMTLAETAERLKIDDPLLPKWRDVLANLTPFPVDDTGLMIGRDRPLLESHRHYSHLLAIYPLHLITPDQPDGRALIEKSLAHWTSMPDKFRGFSYTGASAMYSLLGQGDQSVDFLHQLLDKVIKPNTFYTEAGPVIETPLSGATSVQDMLLQSWGGKVRVFPAIPTSWSDVSFATLRAEGGYLVTAVRQGGQTAWVKVEYTGHEPNAKPCHVVVSDWKSALVRDGTATQVKAVGEGEFIVDLAKPGASVLLAPTASAELPPVAPIATPVAEHNPYPQHYKSALP